jgi:hypothetical protein
MDSTRFLLADGGSPSRFWLPGVPFFPRELRKWQMNQMKKANGKILSNIRISVSSRISAFF